MSLNLVHTKKNPENLVLTKNFILNLVSTNIISLNLVKQKIKHIYKEINCNIFLRKINWKNYYG